MTYWLDLFTGTTWDEFVKAGAHVSGFRASKRAAIKKIGSGDILLCYLTGVGRWIGALEVVGPSTDTSRIWDYDQFPERLEVKTIVALTPEHGVPLEALKGKVLFFADESMRGGYRGFLRGSPASFKRQSDGELILNMMNAAKKNPVARPFDRRQLSRKPTYAVERQAGGKKVEAVVTVPEPEELPAAKPLPNDEGETVTTRHTEIQWSLLTLGAEMGLDVWVARNDRSRLWNKKRLGDVDRMVQSLPTQFNEATTRTVELIDVLWLKGNSIVAAFEVECTTSIYSGLLRMSDLMALQPNLDIKLYLVAPEERRDKVEQEIQRPTFSLREKPLPEACGFLPFGKLVETVDGIRKLKLAASLQPSFLESVAEYFTPE